MHSGSFQIGEIIIHPDKNEICTALDIYRVEHRLIQILQLLANAAGKTVSKQEIAEQVWAPKLMSDESLAQAISQLRKYLGDSAAKSQVIRTIPKVGYSLVSEVTWNSPPPTVFNSGNHGRNVPVQLILGVLCAILAGLLLYSFGGNEEIEIEEIEIERSESLIL